MTHHWRLITDESSSGTAKSYCVILYFPLMLQKKCLTVAPVIPVYPVSGLILRFFWHVSESFTVDAVDSFVVSCSSGFVAWLGGTFFPSVLAFPVSCLLVPLRLRLSLLFPFLGFPPSFPHPLGFRPSVPGFPSFLPFPYFLKLPCSAHHSSLLPLLASFPPI